MPLPSPIIDQFRAHLRHTDRSQSTIDKYGQAADRFLGFCGDQGLDFTKLPIGVLTIFSEYLRARGLSAASVHAMSAGAKKFLGWLRARGAIEGAEFSDPDLPKLIHEAPNAVSTEDLIAFLSAAAAQQEPQRTAILLLPFCGLRSNELTKLDLSSIVRVDWPTRTGETRPSLCFYVPKERSKNGKARHVPLLPDGNHILINYLQTWRRTRSQNTTWLFPMSDGQPISNRTIRHYVQHIREAIGKSGDRLTPHTMRRTYATALHLDGVSDIALANIMGHKNIQTTVSHYLEVKPVDIAGAVGRSGAVLLAKGPYADEVANAGHNASDFFNSLKRDNR